MDKVIDNVITLVRGDTFKHEVQLLGVDDVPYVVAETDIIKFGLKGVAGGPVLISKIIPHDTMILQINPEDTRLLESNKYMYDISLTRANGESYTIVPCSVFNLALEVSE